MKKSPELSLLKAMAMLRGASVAGCPVINRLDGYSDNLPELSQRVRHLLHIMEKQRPAANMIFFV